MVRKHKAGPISDQHAPAPLPGMVIDELSVEAILQILYDADHIVGGVKC
ncbi:MAG: hypothetical protein ACR2PG_00775 [Hyphomicrobiaceae bacterium]